jgi:PTH1 family peptidyl-tRNA hydrolase
MRLFAGLGNPGTAFATNRHNVGFMAVDRIASRYGFSPWRRKGSLLISEGQLESGRTILTKPQSFINKSGLPIADIARFHRIDPSNVFVFHDELDLAAGKVRVKVGGGHGGHNGLRDINRHFGSNYWRVRIGIGRPPFEPMDVKAWVLTDFSRDEQTGWVPELLDAITEEINRLCQHDDSGFMSRVAYLAPAPSTP